ncbi:MAG: helix-turn-helix domain-containing protein [Sedimentisphaerales bacterium]|nr:helix-turn-helix domain-containing protein [Sedimentisphaerales bacterium]
MEIGKRIRELRIRRGLKQVDLANALTVSPQAVSKWERCETCPDIITLPELARILGVTTDYLLGVTEQQQGQFEATVFCSSLNQFARKSISMESKELAEWANVIFHHLTEAALRYDAVPVKYVGDGFLCFFSGGDHANRALKAAVYAKQVIQNPSLIITLNSGDIYLGTIGHPDYCSKDICGQAVNLAFLIMDYVAQHCSVGIGLTEMAANRIDKAVVFTRHTGVRIDAIDTDITVFEPKLKS